MQLQKPRKETGMGNGFGSCEKLKEMNPQKGTMNSVAQDH